MDFEYIYPIIVLFGSFAIMLAVGVPITFAIGLSSLFSILIALPPDAAISVISQKMTVGLDGFTLLAIPFFVLAGNIMNTGGIARRLVNLAQALVGLAGALQYSGEHPVWRDIRLGCRFCGRGGRHHVAITGKRGLLSGVLYGDQRRFGADWPDDPAQQRANCLFAG